MASSPSSPDNLEDEDCKSQKSAASLKHSLQKYIYPSPEKRKHTETDTTPNTPSKRATRFSVTPQISSPQDATTSTRPRPSNSTSSTISARKRKPTSRNSSQPRTTVVNKLTDALAPGLLVMFVGVNPGIRTAETGHAYAHPSNLFWKLLHTSGLTDRRCLPSETHDLVPLYLYGNTNIVTRPTRDASALSTTEMDEGVAVVEEKVRRDRPEVVCLVGKGIWQSVERVWKARGVIKGPKDGKRGNSEFRYGFQDYNIGRIEDEWEGARLFVATTTSGLAAGMSWAEKLEVWKELGEWVGERRKETGDDVNGEEKGDGEHD